MTPVANSDRTLLPSLVPAEVERPSLVGGVAELLKDVAPDAFEPLGRVAALVDVRDPVDSGLEPAPRIFPESSRLAPCHILLRA